MDQICDFGVHIDLN